MADRFSYHYRHTIDPKGRIIIPSKFREQLGNPVTMMRGSGPCIKLLSRTEWNRVTEKFAQVDEDENPELYDKMRRLVSTSIDDIVPDKQSRLLIDPQMRKYAKLDKDVVVAGMGRHVEIWDKELYFAFAQLEDE